MAAIELDYAYRECEQITRREAANFYYGIRLLSRFKRQAMCATYAFARRVDDIGDDGALDRASSWIASPSSAAGLRRWLTAGPHRRSGHDRARALDRAISPAGRRARTADRGRRARRARRGVPELRRAGRYCRCVAGSVGRLCLAIFSDGAASDDAYSLADDLGVAMQLTNILRDIVEDQDSGPHLHPGRGSRALRLHGSGRRSRARRHGSVRFEAERAAEWFDRGLRLVELLDVPQRVVCSGHDRDLPADSRPDPRGPGTGDARPDLALSAREDLGRGAQPGRGRWGALR